MPTRIIHSRQQSGKPIVSGDTTFIPTSQTTLLRWPGARGGLWWQRPHSIIVLRGNDPPTTLPIYDTTRLMQIGVLILAAASLISLILTRRRRLPWRKN